MLQHNDLSLQDASDFEKKKSLDNMHLIHIFYRL